jgi:predicted metalloprotease with PDZ domain
MNRYILRVREPHARRAELSLEAEARGQDTLDFRIPVWTPGSYLVREHQRHVDSFTAVDEQGRSLPVGKIDKHTWRVGTNGARTVRVDYRLSCFELTVRTNHVDKSHAFLNPSAACAFVVGREGEPCAVRLELPNGWQTWVALPEKDGVYFAADFDELADSPFELGPLETHQQFDFIAQGVVHKLVVWGRGDLDGKRVCDDIARIIDAEAGWFGGLPYKDPYIFILHLNDKGRGGLEHRRSCALLAPRFSFVHKASYEDFLELVAHEFFHLWNVKRLRPAAFTPYDWTRENHTALLWAMEGLTSTYEVMALRRANLITPERFLEIWAERLTQLLRTPGRLRTTLEQASFDAWIKHYRPDETTANSTVSYYLKGSVVGFLLDLELRRRSEGAHSLDDLMRALLKKHGTAPGLPESGVEEAALELVPEAERAGLSAFFQRALRSTEELDLAAALGGVGLTAVVHASSGSDDKGSVEGDPAGAPQPGMNGRALLGAALRDRNGLLEISQVVEGGSAQAAALCAGDELVAVDGFRSEMRQRLSRSLPGQRVRVQFFRQDELQEAVVEMFAAPVDTVTLVPRKSVSAGEEALRSAWLGAVWPPAEEVDS